MFSTRTSRISAGAACLVATFAGATVSAASANGDGSAIPTYKEFKASTYVDVDGAYVVNGDEAISTDGDLKKFYERLVGPEDTQADG